MSEIPKHLVEHCNQLGFTSIEGYFSWCKINKFSLSLNKSQNQLYKEKAFITESKALSVLKRANVASDLKSIIMQYSFGNVFNPINWMTTLYETNDRKTVTDFLLYLNKKTKILEYKEYHGTLSLIFTYSDKWVRPIHEWEPKSKNTHRQISSLLRHLFAKYEVPAFMDSAWIVPSASLNTYWADWYIHIGMGNNIRTAKQLPYPMTKKEAHLFMQTPDALSIQDGFTYAQVMNNGGDWRLVRTLLGTRIKGFYQDNLFKNSLIKFFVDNPMLDHEQMGPIVDYIWNQKFETREVFLERGIREMEPPPQPNFSMTGRTAESLMNQVDRWHRQLGKEKKGGNLQWSHSSINDFHYTEGKGDTRKDWAIIELLSSNELASEGRSMHHCVSSYAHSCASRRTSIWSLRMTDKTGTYIYLTIELKQNQICQMRGKNNRMPEPKERMIVERWASKEKLTIDTYGWF